MFSFQTSLLASIEKKRSQNPHTKINSEFKHGRNINCEAFGGIKSWVTWMRSPRKFLEHTKIQHPEVEIRQRSCRRYEGDNYLFLFLCAISFNWDLIVCMVWNNSSSSSWYWYWSYIEIHHHVFKYEKNLERKRVAGMLLLLPLGGISTIDMDSWASSRAKNHLFVHPTWVGSKRINSTSAPFPIFCLKAKALRRKKNNFDKLGQLELYHYNPKIAFKDSTTLAVKTRSVVQLSSISKTYQLHQGTP